MQTHHQYGQCVDQSFGGIGTQVACEQRTVRQRELQMLGDQNGLQRLAITAMTTRHHGDRLHSRQFQLLQPAQQLIFSLGHIAGDFLHRINFVAYVHETHHVPRDASRQIGQQVFGPGRQRLFPRQGEHLRIRACGGDLQRLRFRRLCSWILGLHGSGLKHTGIHLGQFNRFHNSPIYPLTYPRGGLQQRARKKEAPHLRGASPTRQ